MDKRYVELVRLLIEAAPSVFEGKPFALKGGTAINLFVTDMPRLSVDLDPVRRLEGDDGARFGPAGLGIAENPTPRIVDGVEVLFENRAAGEPASLRTR